MKRALPHLIASALWIVASTAAADVTSTRIEGVEPLPSEWLDATQETQTTMPQALSNAIFQRLGRTSIGSIEDGDISSGVKVGRRVFINGDIEESFTVVDRMQLPISFPGFSFPIGGTVFTFNIGFRTGMDFTNIRIVKPDHPGYVQRFVSELLQADDLQSRRNEVANSDWMSSVLQSFRFNESGGYYEAPTGPGASFSLLDSMSQAQFGKLWNLVAAPLRIPFKAAWLKNLDNNEVMTYGGSGMVSVGPSIGWNLDFVGLDDSLNIGASLRAYLRGDFQISVLKIDENRVKVKVTRKLTEGVNGGFGASLRIPVYEGYLVSTSLGETRLGETTVSLVPFAISQDRSLGQLFEVGYEYDLRDDRAVRAYENAMIGNFAASAELIDQLKAEGRESPVKEAFRKAENSRRQVDNVSIRLHFLKMESQGSYTIQNATVIFPDGTSKVFKAKTEIVHQQSADFLLFARRELVRYKVETDLIEDITHPERDSRFGWIGEMEIQDDDTSGYELNRYSSMIEGILGQEKLFPKVPYYVPTEGIDDTRVPEETRYGGSYFRARIGLTLPQLIKLANTPEDRMWNYIEAGFEQTVGVWTGSAVGRIISGSVGWTTGFLEWIINFFDIDQRLGSKFWGAKRFHDQWVELAKVVREEKMDGTTPISAEAKKRFSLVLSEMYADQTYTYELIRATLTALREGAGEKDMSLQIAAQSSAFPSLSIKTGSLTEVERFAQRYARETDFNTSYNRLNSELEISDLIVESLGDGRTRLTFTAAKSPEMLLIKLDEISSFLSIQTTVKRLLIPNRGQFQEGVNRIILDPRDGLGFESDLAKAIHPGQTYRMTLALLVRDAAGPATSKKFEAKP